MIKECWITDAAERRLQAEVIEFLSNDAAYSHTNSASVAMTVEKHETHGAVVFLAGPDAYKIKRAVRFPYMDYSTLEKRRIMVEAELHVNRPNAPDLYLGSVPVTREKGGRLALNGAGEPVEWCVHMRRFSQTDLLSAYIARGAFTRGMALQLADLIFESHSRADPIIVPDINGSIVATISDLAKQLATMQNIFEPEDIKTFQRSALSELQRAKEHLQQRSSNRHVRRCHGDLHLDNVVILQGMPTLFDAIEFNDDIAVIDVFNDLAFLLMDLDHHGSRAIANEIFNRYLSHLRDPQELGGLLAMTLFLSLRSAVRALVTAQRAAQKNPRERGAGRTRAQTYFKDALQYLQPQQARLLAIGGLSGSGKSTVAAQLAPHIGANPGAVLLRTDVQRKAMLRLTLTEKLPANNYSLAASEQVYAAVLERARIAIAANQSVIIDAVFSRPTERTAVEVAARECGVPFTGLWLDAPRDTLLARVRTRTDDASDADAEVVRAQFSAAVGSISWSKIDASGTVETTVSKAKDAIAECR